MEYIITAEQDGKTVKDFLRRDCKISSTLLRRLKTIPDGITLDGTHVTVRAVLSVGQKLCLKDEDFSSSENIIATEGDVDIFYEDNDLMIINKPFGMPVHPSAGHIDDTLANILVWRFEKAGVAFVFRAVNRLDSGTGGLLCVAKNAHCAKILSSALANDEVERTYQAVLVGELPQDSGIINAPIGLCDGSSLKRCVRDDGERAVTHFKVLERRNGKTRVEVSLETGRTHQIRVHFSHLGYPVWGDFLYGEETDFRGHGLYSCKMAFVHPISGEKMVFEGTVPQIFDDLMSGTLT